MKDREIVLTPSEFMSGYLLGDYGSNNLNGSDPLTTVLRETAPGTVGDGPRSIVITMPPIKMQIDKTASGWDEMLTMCEKQILKGMDLVEVFTYLVNHHFEQALMSREMRQAPQRLLFDFIASRLIHFERAVRFGWDDGRQH